MWEPRGARTLWSERHGACQARAGRRCAARRAGAPPRAAGARIVFTNGCFDLLHPGHVRYLEAARALGDVLVVGLNDDASVRRLKGPGRPILPLAERAEVLAGLAAVDHVSPFAEDTPLALIEALAPDVLVKGADWAADDIVGRDQVLARGGPRRAHRPGARRLDDASSSGASAAAPDRRPFARPGPPWYLPAPHGARM